MKFLIVFLTLLSSSAFCADPSFKKLSGNKYANGDTVELEQVTIYEGKKPLYYSGCKGLVLTSSMKSSLHKSYRELTVEREYFIQFQCLGTDSLIAQTFKEDQIKKLIKSKQTEMPTL